MIDLFADDFDDSLDDEPQELFAAPEVIGAAADAILGVPFAADAVSAALLERLVEPDQRAAARVAATARLLLVHFGVGRRLLRDELRRCLERCPPFLRAFGQRADVDVAFDGMAPRMLPARGCEAFAVPQLTTPGELAAWLGLHDDELQDLARSWHGDGARHYWPRWRPRRGAPPRLLEVPKQRLADVQRRIARHLLRTVPPHPAAHGFACGRSVSSALREHVGSACLLRLDLEDCFASFGRGRVRRVFLNLGYPEVVADLLTRLCTVATPHRELQSLAVVQHARAQRFAEKLRRAHLPQGAPTSPMLANLCAFAIDARLHGLARRFGATYTRYADDLLFSGDERFARDAGRCAVRAAAILLQSGLHIAHHKTRIMRRGTAQRACGLVVNERLALPRRERERLEAILHNCVVHGPSTQNREGVADFRAVLQGKVAHARRFDRAGRLAALLAAIDWSR